MDTKNLTDWSRTPHTDKKAVPIAWKKHDIDSRVISVAKGRIRGATVSGFFQVADVLNPNSTYAGKQRIQVICYWHGKKPSTCWMNLTVDFGYTDVPNHIGEVIVNIGRPS